MTAGLLFWILMIIWFVFGLWTSWPRTPGSANFPTIGGTVMLFILIALLGWKVFGPILR